MRVILVVVMWKIGSGEVGVDCKRFIREDLRDSNFVKRNRGFCFIIVK